MTTAKEYPNAGAFPNAGSLASPCVVIDELRLAKNIAEMQTIANAGGVALHPHIKTHKSLAIADFQRVEGAKGVTASHPAEAAVFVRAGFSPVTLAYPVIEAEPLSKLLELGSQCGVKLRFIADSYAGVAALAAAAEDTGKTVDVFMKVDTGLHRCGVDPGTEEAGSVAKAIHGASHLVFAGLLSHAGHSYGAGGLDGVRAVASGEAQILKALKAKLMGLGVSVPLVSVGSTPTLIANAGFDGIDEVRPGNYVFYDMTAVRLGIVNRGQIALAVVATIISANSESYIVDAGSKTLSSDLGPHSVAGVTGYGEAWSEKLDRPLIVEKLSEEHGIVGRQGTGLEIGDRLLIYPNHACVVANLAAELVLLSNDGASRMMIDAADPSARLAF
ncbi:alanine racemase [Martelella mediterranea]|uniref:D-serine deaminase-like pyridoxal phosphate-dependent protein n=1 Tax=Martelella mediterranea TaxID=293089 RepID=A0A4V2V4R2_9HYPH|nr:alanine racemase [Martelella mediterranea]TCT42140.1 D-serine deaminase-like pyridoxal phosphate-dependent protein [Martelella mediterranea]